MSNITIIILTTIFLIFFSVAIFYWGVIIPRKKEGLPGFRNYSRRDFRRLVVSILLLLVAILIIASVTVISFENRPLFWALYMGGVLLILCLIIILAIVDFFTTVKTSLLQFSKGKMTNTQSLEALREEIKLITLKKSSRNGSTREKSS